MQAECEHDGGEGREADAAHQPDGTAIAEQRDVGKAALQEDVVADRDEQCIEDLFVLQEETAGNAKQATGEDRRAAPPAAERRAPE